MRRKKLYIRQADLPGKPWDVVFYDNKLPGDSGVRVVYPGCKTPKEARVQAERIAKKYPRLYTWG